MKDIIDEDLHVDIKFIKRSFGFRLKNRWRTNQSNNKYWYEKECTKIRLYIYKIMKNLMIYSNVALD